jgi:hypothetical protein
MRSAWISCTMNPLADWLPVFWNFLGCRRWR